jgi:hypothetical protein
MYVACVCGAWTATGTLCPTPSIVGQGDLCTADYRAEADGLPLSIVSSHRLPAPGSRRSHYHRRLLDKLHEDPPACPRPWRSSHRPIADGRQCVSFEGRSPNRLWRCNCWGASLPAVSHMPRTQRFSVQGGHAYSSMIRSRGRRRLAKRCVVEGHEHFRIHRGPRSMIAVHMNLEV